MKNIREEIAGHMFDLKQTEQGGLTARFIFPEDFIGYQGHFPGNKILPGVCQIQCIITMLEKWGKKNIVLKEIVLAKFLSSILPSEELTCACNDIGESSGVFTLKASCRKNDEKVAELKLKVCFKGEIKEK